LRQEGSVARVLMVAMSGPADPTKAVLPFLTARNLKELGHEPALFLAGDSVLLIRDEVVDAVVGVEPGSGASASPARSPGSL